MLFTKWELIFRELFVGLAFLVLLVFLLSRGQFFRNVMQKNATSALEKMAMAAFFGIVGILGNYIGVPTDDGLANTRAVGVIAGGLVGGPISGFGAGLIAGAHRYSLGGFTVFSSTLSTILEGLVAGLLKKKFPHGKERWIYALLLSLILEIFHMALLLVLSRPIEQALHFVSNISLPMLIMNPIGVAAIIAILENVMRAQEKVEGSAARLTLKIASNTITFLRKGLNPKSAKETAQIIFETSNTLAAVAITDCEKVLAFVGTGADHHSSSINTTSTKLSIASGEYTIYQNRREIGCPRHDCPLGSKIVAPLKDHDKVIGTLTIYKFEENDIKPFEIELIKGLALLISTQLEISKSEHQAALLARAEIQSLQAQVNPHFLFNALNTIVYYCRRQPDTARNLLIHLGNYYRNNLTTPDYLISLDTELQRINDYVKIETARFQGKLNVIYDIPDECTCQVPAFILQPLVENAIKHGLYKKKAGGKVIISGRIVERNVVVFVDDDGVGMDEEQVRNVLNPDSGHIGIANVNARMKSFYGENYQLSVESKVGDGTRVTLTFPLGGDADNVKCDNR
jgi:two-component system sensor histidine kinase LytS